MALSPPVSVVAYVYQDPLLEPDVTPIAWGQPLDRIYWDRGDRTQLAQLLQDCHTGSITLLVLRRLKDLGDTVTAISECCWQLHQLGVQICSLAAVPPNGVPTGVPLSPAEVLRSLAADPPQVHGQAIQRGHARNRLQAIPPPGKAPYGYRRRKDRYVVDRATAPVVKDFFEQFLLYGSLRRAVRYLQQKYGKRIAVSTGRRWLTHPVYRGDLAYRQGEIIPDTHPALLSREEAAQVDRLLRRNRRLPPRTASAPRSLAGLVFCGECQCPFRTVQVTAPRRAQTYVYLRPAACPHRPHCPSLRYEQVLEKTIAAVCQELPVAVAGLSNAGLEQMRQQLTTAQSQKQAILAQLPSLVMQGILDEETAALRAYKVRNELATLQMQQAQLPPPNLTTIAQTVSLPQFWLDLSEVERRFYLREFIQQIQIIRSNHVLSDRLSSEAWQIRLVFIF
ncbi:recombinase family protein [Trichothermofontia sichuanensis B231]|uniref:recombinase family protein n=1 Tax=Trichothermofontia sichuanensis TaxID=3045816 RepID=UPI002246C0C6|nr:recombinase family protein [Trichothermofontia sichuanensis]UZQ53380.1 recombinase family protein [Trichothermofontia sichuanensis B231]